MLKDYNLAQKCFLVFTGIVLIAFVFVLLSPVNSSNIRYESDSEFNVAWSYMDNLDSGSKAVTLPYIIPLSSGRASASIANIIPSDVDNGDKLYINLRNASVQVTIDGQPRAVSNPEELSGRLFTVPQNAWAIVPLSVLDAGKVIKIDYSLPHIINSTYIGDIIIGGNSAGVAAMYADNITVYMGAVVLLLLGVFIFGSGCIFSKDPERRKLVSLLALYTVLYSIGKFQYCSQTLIMVRNDDLMMWFYYVLMSFLCAVMISFARQAFRFIPHNEFSNRSSAIATVMVFTSIIVLSTVAAITPIELTFIMALLHLGLIATAIWFLIYIRPRIDLFKYPAWVAAIAVFCLIIQIFDLLAFLIPGHYTFLATGTAISTFVEVFAAWIVILRDIYIGKEENQVIKEQLMDSKVQLMISQIRPHFIYNVLNSINILITQDGPKAQKLVQQFSLYLRRNMNAMEDFGLSPFKDELDHIRAYVDIEQVRFPRIGVVYEIDESNFRVPVLSVEPLVENAIKHGISKKREGGQVTIRAYRSKEYYYIEVKDNGVGFDAASLEKAESKSIGIKNIKYRIETMTKGSLSITSEVGKGTSAVIKLPVGVARIEQSRSDENEDNIG